MSRNDSSASQCHKFRIMLRSVSAYSPALCESHSSLSPGFVPFVSSCRIRQSVVNRLSRFLASLSRLVPLPAQKSVFIRGLRPSTCSAYLAAKHAKAPSRAQGIILPQNRGCEFTPGTRDKSRINVPEDREILYWTERFGVSRQQLLEAVKRAGTSPAKVAKELGK